MEDEGCRSSRKTETAILSEILKTSMEYPDNGAEDQDLAGLEQGR